MPITQQAKSPTGIITRGLRMGRKKVLTQEKVVISVTIKIGNTHPKGRSDLRLERQGSHFKMVSSIEKDCRFEPIGFELCRPFQFVAVNLIECRVCIGIESRKFLIQKRDCSAN